MIRYRAIGVIVAVICSFLASSLWYSPALFGNEFFALSGVVASSQPDPAKVAGEILRNVILALAILWLLTRQRPTRFRSVLVLAGILWIGFPVMLLSGSVMWQNVPPELAIIHCGDWLIKILLMTSVPWIVSRKAEARSSQQVDRAAGLLRTGQKHVSAQ